MVDRVTNHMSPQEVLKQYWGYSSFRPQQEEIIKSVIDGQDTLALLPTGGGKSICFQVPAMLLEGICIVISPLIALMKDQVEQLNNRGIKATAIFSGMSKREIDVSLDNCIYGDVKFLYVSPERLQTELMVERSKKMKVSLLAVDEAHCISQWGYDFRPPYLEIADFKNQLNIPSVVALTATATNEVETDIIAKLEMKSPQIFRKSFARANLSYSAFALENKEGKLLDILRNVEGSSVVYVRSRKRTKQVAELLIQSGISADFYHAGLTGKERSAKQDAWIQNSLRVMVATNAFGMGIDKANVRTVIHLDLPDSLEAYYQEAGRAGRDGKKAYAIVLYHQKDLDFLKERAEKSVVSIDLLQRTYQALGNYFKLAVGSHAFSSFPFHYDQFIQAFNLPLLDTYAALRKLEEEGLIQLNDSYFEGSKFIFNLNKSDTYKYQIANPKLDPVIKALLRLYGGEAFNVYQRLKEKEIATLVKGRVSDVRLHLKFLHDHEVIDYQPSSDSPTITFLTPRLEADKIPIDAQQLDWRRKLAIEKAGAVAAYVQADGCRTQIFQHYFNEDTVLTCGICDNDLERRKKIKAETLPLDELETLLDAPRSLTQIKALLAKHPEIKIVDGLRILIEDGKVMEENGVFSRIDYTILRGGGEES
ncbi:MAG: ATP-dependent DNA helicase RecQ [Bacteroidota bacterium]